MSTQAFVYEKSRRFMRLKLPRGRLRYELCLPGLDTYDDALRFSTEVYDEERARIVATAATGDTLFIKHLAKGKAYKPSDEDLEIINERHAEREFSEEELFIFQRFPANDQPSRSLGLIFTEGALEKLAQDYDRGRSRLLYHSRREIVGRTFYGDVVETEVRGISGKFVQTKEYIPHSTKNADLILDIESGIFAYDSMGLHIGSAIDFVELGEGEKRRNYIRIDYNPDEQFPLEAEEVSFVYLGELRGVGSHKGLAVEDSGGPTTEGESSHSASSRPKPSRSISERFPSNRKQESKIWHVSLSI